MKPNFTTFRVALCNVLLSTIAATLAMAGQDKTAGTDQQSQAGVPDFISARKEIPTELLDRKKEGKYWIGFPIIGYDPDTRLTIGAAANFFDDGPKDSPFFRYNGYNQKLSLGAAYSTGGASLLRLNYDAPNLNGSPWHVYAGAIYTKSDYENYFGVGRGTLDPLSYPGSNQTYGKYESYLDAINQINNGQTYTYYDNYSQELYRLDLSIERDTLGGILRPMFGIQVGYYNIGDYTGTKQSGAVVQPTHLRSDQDAGRIKGFGGGWDNALKVGLTYDTRDFAPNPSTGLFLQAIARGSLKAFGSIEDYGQFKLEARGYYSPFGKKVRLTFAGRLGYLAQTSNTPFYVLSLAPDVDNSKSWLGGFESLRGFQNNRFVGQDVAIASGSVRWWFGESTLWNQNLGFGLAAFVDSGNVYDSIGDTTFKDWKVSGGVGFLLSWNVNTVVSFDLGKSGEGALFYMGLGMPF